MRRLPAGRLGKEQAMMLLLFMQWRQDANLARALEDRHDQRINDNRGRDGQDDQVQEVHIHAEYARSVQQRVHLLPGLNLYCSTLWRLPLRRPGLGL